MATPCLSNRVKAVESRHLVPIVSSIFDSLRSDNEEDQQISGVLKGLSKAYDAMDSTEQNLTAAQLEAFQSGLDACLGHYRWLHMNSLDRDDSQWHEVPKHHFTQHLKEQASLQNPRWCWTYPDEDFMGYVKHITESCLAGTRAHRAVRKMLQKWSFGIAVRMSRGA